MIGTFVNTRIFVLYQSFKSIAILTIIHTLHTVAAEPVTVTNWRAWDQLSEAEKAGIAPYCGGSYVAPLTVAPSAITDQQSLILFNSGSSDQDMNHRLNGDVKIYSQQYMANADQVLYSTTEQLSDLNGNVVLHFDNNGLSGDTAQVNLENYYALVRDAQFVLYGQDLHGDAELIERHGENSFEAQRISFTRCAPTSNAWNLKASTLTIDNEEGLATAWNARVEVKDVPVLYTPYISFPLDDRPRTGFLTPTFGSVTTVPYYLNLAPNYDDTIMPVITDDEGSLLRNEFRFLTEDHSGTNQIDYQITQGDSDVDDARWAFSHQQEGSLPYSIEYDFETRWVSDENFDPAYNAGGDEVDEQTVELDLSKTLSGYKTTWGLEYTQPVDDSDEDFVTFDSLLKVQKGIFTGTLHYEMQEEYEETSNASAASYDYLRAPELALTFKPKQTLLGFSTQESVRVGYFTRDLSAEKLDALSGDNLDYATDAFRAHGSLTVNRTYKNNAGFYFKPKAELFATAYDLTNDEGYDLDEAYGGDSVTQYAGRITFDQGANLVRSGTEAKHTFSPRLYYAYAPLTDQEGPILDADETTSFKLFTSSRFSGYDRVGDMSRLSAGLGYKYRPNALDYDRFTISMSKGVKLAQERLTEDGVDDVDDDWELEYSDWNGSLTYQPFENLIFEAEAEIDDDWSELSTFNVSAHYNPSDNSFAYFEAKREEDDDDDDILKDYISAGAYLPIRQNLAFITYVSMVKETEDSGWDQFTFSDLLYGLEYDSCCWNIRFATLESADEDDDDDSSSLYPSSVDRSYYIEVTLKGITSGTGNIESILNRLDFGYTGKLFNYR